MYKYKIIVIILLFLITLCIILILYFHNKIEDTELYKYYFEFDENNHKIIPGIDIPLAGELPEGCVFIFLYNHENAKGMLYVFPPFDPDPYISMFLKYTINIYEVQDIDWIYGNFKFFNPIFIKYGIEIDDKGRHLWENRLSYYITESKNIYLVPNSILNKEEDCFFGGSVKNGRMYVFGGGISQLNEDMYNLMMYLTGNIYPLFN